MKHLVSAALILSLVISCKGDSEQGGAKSQFTKAKRAQTEVVLSKVKLGYEQWRMKTGGTCPSSSELAGYLNSEAKDAWGSALQFDCKDGFVVTSPGPDKKLGTDDDLSAR